MQAARATSALLPEGATALQIPTDRPAFVDSFAGFGVPPAATAVRLVVPPSERPKGRPEHEYVTLRLSPEQSLYAKRFAYAYITTPEAPAHADPVPFIRLVFRTLALDLPQTFEVFAGGGFGDAALRFRTPAEREAAMRRQPFQLDGATVTLLRDNEIVPNVPARPTQIMVHVARAVFRLHHPREIPRELRIGYDDGSTSVVPVQIVRVWASAHSYDAAGRYVPLFQAPAAAA